MALISTRHGQGFLPYGSSDPDVIGYASLLSALDTTIGAFPVTEGAAVNYTDQGMQVSTSQADGSKFQYENLAPEIAFNGTVTFWIEKGYFGSAKETANALILESTGGTKFWLERQASNGAMRSVSNGAALGNVFLTSNEGSDTHIRVDISFSNYGVDVYKDYMLCSRNAWAATKPSFSTHLNISGAGAGTQKNTVYRIKNLQITRKPISLPEKHNLNIAFIGDSFTKLGQYPSANLFNKSYAQDPSEYANDGTLQNDSSLLDSGMFATVHKELGKRGLYIKDNKVKFHGRGGTQVNSGSLKPLSERVLSLQAQNGGTDYPSPGERDNTNVVVCIVGTNDIAASVSDATFEADYKTEVDNLDTIGCEHIILLEIIKRHDADYDTDIAAKNVIINSLESYNSKVSVVTIYNLLTSESSVLGDGIHPSASAHVTYGEEIAKVIARVVV